MPPKARRRASATTCVADGQGLAKAFELAAQDRRQRAAVQLRHHAGAAAHRRHVRADGLFVESLMSAIAQGDEAAKQRVRDFLAKRAGKVGKAP